MHPREPPHITQMSDFLKVFSMGFRSQASGFRETYDPMPIA
jgi:hypothetical protein